MLLSRIGWLGLLLLMATNVAASEPLADADRAAIEKVAAKALAAEQTGDWGTYADQFHPAAWMEFRELFAPALEASAAGVPQAASAWLPLFDGATSVKQLLGLTPRDLFASFMKGSTSQSGFAARFATTKTSIIGTLLETPDTAQVVYRVKQKLGPMELNKVNVLALQKHDKEWRLLLPDELKALAFTFRQSFAPGNVQEAQATEEVQPAR